MKNHYPYQNIFNKIFSILLCFIINLSNNCYSEETIKLKRQIWSFDGIFGKVDRQAAQRGFQVYKEVCAACHALEHLSYRNLKDIGFSEEEIKELAKEYTLPAEPNENGEIKDRPATINDKFVRPYSNTQMARVANNGALPPDLSLIIKSRHDGANYIFSLLTGYTNPPADLKILPGLYYNPYFPGHQIAMAPPLVDNQIAYADGTVATVEQMTRDVTIFLQWASEPEMEHRKSLGLKVLLFLTIFTIFFYLSKLRIWRDIH